MDPIETPYYTLDKWKEWDKSTGQEAVRVPSDHLPNGHDLPRKNILNGISGKNTRQREEKPSEVDAKNASTYLTAA